MPSGFLGILHLWRGNDQRPHVRSAITAGAPAGPAPFPPDPAAPVPPDTMMRCVAHALDPLDVPDVAGKEKKKTTIQNIPAGSLAQAFLEVFADIGKQHLADELLKVARRMPARPTRPSEWRCSDPSSHSSCPTVPAPRPPPIPRRWPSSP